MKFKYAFGFLGVAFFALSSLTNASAQNLQSVTNYSKAHEDLLASQSFIQDQIKVDEIQDFASQLYEELEPESDIYTIGWDCGLVDAYSGSGVQVPDKQDIDVSDFCMPCPKANVVTSNYGYRRRFGRAHKGVDLRAAVGDTVRAAFDGKVRLTKYERRGYGYYVIVRHENGLETVYGHLSRFLVKPNDYVKAGDPIALSGNTGRSTGPHLHFETRFLGQAINPAEIIDFERCEPIKPQYVFRNIKIKGRKSNIYTSSDQNIVFHRVRSGDNLSVIAKKYGTTVSQLCRLNGITTKTIIRPGQSLRLIPSGSYKK